MSEPVLYEENQYLGYHKFSIASRTLFAIFCFILYYWSENPKPVSMGAIRIGPYPARHIEGSGHLFFLLGLGVLLLSVLLLFVLHFRIKVTEKGVFLGGFLKARKTMIPVSEITAVKKVRFRESFFNRPAYHHYFKGKVRFYSRGNEAVELTRTDGLIFRIGSQRAGELLSVLKDVMSKNKT